ncbi:unnamed protein product [Ectocarpus sp. 4 AP-2014]
MCFLSLASLQGCEANRLSDGYAVRVVHGPGSFCPPVIWTFLLCAILTHMICIPRLPLTMTPQVKDRELRRLNGFVGDRFRMCDVLIVPNRFSSGQQPIQGASGKVPMSRNDMMQVFRKDSQLGAEESRFYLEGNGWELSKALAQWRAENRWESEQLAGVNSIKPPSTTRRHTKQQEQQGRFPAVSGMRRPNSRERGNIEMRTRGEEVRVPLLSEPYAPAPGATLL